jgi:hypothetical protein
VSGTAVEVVALRLKHRIDKADQRRMRHFRTWLLLIGLASLVAEAAAAAAVFWRAGTPLRRP